MKEHGAHEEEHHGADPDEARVRLASDIARTRNTATHTAATPSFAQENFIGEYAFSWFQK
ncbi:hypothetical protein DIPPA_09635 [Diplonema papillatum]|nr:hypothetical protein DIPPA_09635 [Diplonema papillatum]